MKNNRQALIIGGGIGGLAAGIALRNTGWNIRIYERATELREVGAGLSLWANAVRALAKLGVAEKVRALMPPHASGGIYTWRGEPLVEDSSNALERRLGEISVVLHRAELLTILREALSADTISLGKQCVRIAQNEQGVEAHFSDGTSAHGDLLVGCDGIRSVVRTLLEPRSEPLYAGYTAYRSVTAFDTQHVKAGEYWGYGARFGIAPLSAGRVYWFATRNAPPGEHASPEAEQATLLKIFRGWYAPVEAIIRATDPATILRNDIADRDPIKQWNTGRITLLGDAAHPMTPNLGQGACQALEDAVVLATALKNEPTIEKALQTYEQRRIPRTSQIVLQSRRIGQVGQWENRLACSVRNTLTKHLLARVQDRQLDQVIGYRVE